MLMHQYVKRNCDEIAPRAVSAIIAGNVTELAVCMKEAQEDFDHSAIPNCPKQLSSPKLHSLINDDELKSISLAVKGIGSQGDGSAQILCESENLQNKVNWYGRYYNCNPYNI